MNAKFADGGIDRSFCLPVYNVKSFIGDCLKSIRNQELERYNISYEIFCIDDGSADGSYEWLIDKSSEIPQLRVERNEANRGVSYTRNRLAREARGKYVWYIDPDDILIEDIAYKFFELAEENHADVLLGDYVRVSEEASLSDAQVYSEQKKAISIVNSNKLLPQDQNGKVMCAIWAGLFLREFIITNGLTMNEKMIAQEDTLFYYEFSLKSNKIYKCNLNCYLYRQRTSSVMHSHSDERTKKYYLSLVEMLRVYQEHLDSGDYDDVELLKDKIHHSKQNVAQYLASVRDKAYIKQQLKLLKEMQIYPYKFRKAALKSKPFYMGALTFLLPLKPFFWMYHFIYVTTHKSK